MRAQLLSGYGTGPLLRAEPALVLTVRVKLLKAQPHTAPPCSPSGCRPHGTPPIAAQLRGPAHVRHDFGAAPLCVVPLTLQLRNGMVAPAAVAVELGKAEGQTVPLGSPTWAAVPDSSQAGGAALARSGSTLSSSSSAPLALVAAGALPPARQYAWCGRTRVVLPAVPPGQLVEVPLSVAVQRLGKLALVDCTVSWQLAGPPALSGSTTVPPLHVSVAAPVASQH